MVYCPGSDYFVMAEAYYADLGVYSQYSGFFQQYLQYMVADGASIDCSNKYLVSLDSYGNVAYNTYSSFPGWAIGLIVGFVVLVIIVSAVIGKTRRNRRLRANQGFDNYNQVDNGNPNPSEPYFNNGGNQQGAYVPPNQGPYNPPNQGYNNNNNNNSNPYQANQPRNWN